MTQRPTALFAMHSRRQRIPHPQIAGSHGNELGRLDQTAVAELERLIMGVPLAHQALPDDLDRAA